MPSFAIYVLKFYKMKIKLTLKYTLSGQKIKNIEFFQTYIVLMWIKYLDLKISKINLVKFLKKQWIII